MGRRLKKRLFMVLALLMAILFACGFDSQEKKVYDDGDLLTKQDENKLQSDLVNAAGDTEQDLIIVTTRDNEGKGAQAYADDFYDEHGFGYEEENGSGVLLLIDMDERTVYISTSGTAIERYTDEEIEKTLDAITPYVSTAEYMRACSTFISEAKRYLEDDKLVENNPYASDAYGYAYGVYSHNYGHKRNGNQYTERSSANRKTESTKEVPVKRLVTIFLISSAVSALAVFIISGKRKTKMSVNGNAYLRNGGLVFKEQSDRFTHTTVVTRKLSTDDEKEKNNGKRSSGSGRGPSGGGRSSSSTRSSFSGGGRSSSSIGRSSSHTSSGGHSHGGGGRRF